jgi:hypothetical protein
VYLLLYLVPAVRQPRHQCLQQQIILLSLTWWQKQVFLCMFTCDRIIPCWRGFAAAGWSPRGSQSLCCSQRSMLLGWNPLAWKHGQPVWLKMPIAPTSTTQRQIKCTQLATRMIGSKVYPLAT